MIPLGFLTAKSRTAPTPLLASVASAGALGALTPTGSVNQTLGGVTSTGALGGLTTTAGRNQTLGGVTSSGALGGLTTTAGRNQTLAGAAASGALNAVSVTAVNGGKYANLTPAGIGATMGTGYSSTATLGPASASRYVFVFMGSPSADAGGPTCTINGVAATKVVSNAGYIFSALTPTGTTASIVVGNLTNATVNGILVYSADASSAPVISATVSTDPLSNVKTQTATVPVNGCVIAYYIDENYTTTVPPTAPTVDAPFTSLQTATVTDGASSGHRVASAQTPLNLGGQSVTATFSNTGGSYEMVQMFLMG